MKIREQVFILPTSMPGNFLHLLCQGAFFVYTRICAASHAGQAGYRFSHPSDYDLRDSTPIFPFTGTSHLLHFPVQSSSGSDFSRSDQRIFASLKQELQNIGDC